MSHPAFTLLAALLLSLALAMVEDRSPRERIYAGARVFGYSIVALVGGGWLMYLIHG